MPEKRAAYLKVHKRLKRKREGSIFTQGLRTAYENYRKPDEQTDAESVTRMETMPSYTHRKANFKATLDHLIYNGDQLRVEQLLECPGSGVIPNA